MAGPFDHLPDASGGGTATMESSPFAHLPDAGVAGAGAGAAQTSPFAHLPDAQPAASAQSPSAYFAQHPGMDPLAVEQAFNQMQGKANIPQAMSPQQIEQSYQTDRSAAANFGNAMSQTLGAGTVGAVGLLNPQMGQQLRQQNALAYGHGEGLAATAGGLAGNLVQAPLMMNPAGRVLGAAEAAGNARVDVADARAQGQQISGAAELGDATANAALNWLVARIGSKNLTGPTAGTLVKSLFPRLSNQFGQAAARTAMTSLLEGGLGGMQQANANVINKLAGTGPQDVMEGVGTAAATQGVLGLAGRAVHEAMPQEHPGPIQRPANPDQGPQAHAQSDQQQTLPKSEVHVPEYRSAQGDALEREQLAAKHKAGFTLPEANREALAHGPTASAENAQAVPQARSEQVQEHAPANPPRPDELRQGTEGTTPVSEHPNRIEGIDQLTDYYKKNNPNDSTGDILKAMAPHTPYVKAQVPVDFVQGIGEDVDRAKIDQLKGMPIEQRQKLGPAIVGPYGEVFDGMHRMTAAKEAGDSHVLAYVPEDLVGKNGIEAHAPEAAPAPIEQKAATPPNDFLAKMKTLPADESGAATMAATKKFVERDVKPAVDRLVENSKKSWGTINRALGTGLTWDLQDRDSANAISKGLAEHERSMKQVETKLKPVRQHMSGWTDSQKDQWADQVEATGSATDPATQGAADLSHQLNQQNIAEGKKYGLHTKQWEGDYLGRLAEFPADQAQGNGGRTSLAGGENFLKGRVFNTYSEFANFVRQHGGKMVYDNPMDTLLAKQSEIRRSIMARKIMYQQEKIGQLKWVPDNERPPEGMDQNLADKTAQQDRPVIAPKWMVAKLSKMEHFDAQKYMQSPEWLSKTTTLRPGDDLPDKMTYTGQNQSGSYHANANVADQFNNLISPGLKRNIPVLHQLASFVKGTTNLALNLSGAHYLYNGYRSFSGAIGRSISNVANKEWGLLKQNLFLANPIAAMQYGAKGLEEYRNPGSHPELASQVAGAVEGGAKPQMKSVLAPHYFEQAAKEWDEGNIPGSLLRTLKGINHLIAVPLHEHFSPKIKFAAQMMHAAQHEARGLSGEEFTRQQSLATDLTDNLLGQVVRDRQFQNKIVTDTQDLLLTAPKFFEGDLRELGAGVRDGALALRDMAQGKKVKMTPAMYSLMGHALAQTALATLTQMAMTTLHGKTTMPSSLQDLVKPRTGRQDDQGREERVYIPTPLGSILSAVSHPQDALKNRLATPWRAVGGLEKGTDERNVKLESAGDKAKYVIRTMMPYSLQGATQEQRPGRPESLDKKLGETVGLHYSYTPSSDAEKAAYDAIYSKPLPPMSKADKQHSDLRAGLADRLRHGDKTVESSFEQDVREGKLNPRDASLIRHKADQKPGLAGLLNESSLTAQQIVQTVWPRMTPDEKKQYRLLVKGKIGRSTMSDQQKQDLWKQME